MKCSVFIATSADGYIATPQGDVDWLMEAAASEEPVAMGLSMEDYMQSVDCMVMGLKCMEKIASFNLTPEQWPYGDTRIIVLSQSLTQVPDGLPDTVELYSGDIPRLMAQLDEEGYQHAYVDGGSVITSFLNLKLINEMVITQAPLILGDGLRLFGKIDHPIRLREVTAEAFANGFSQSRFTLQYD